ncbi:MAG: hypothetical protein ABW321_06935 [Polyangiales bacterium]
MSRAYVRLGRRLCALFWTLLFWTLLFWTLAACTATPPDGVYRCTRDSQCPKHMLCDSRLLVCTREEDNDAYQGAGRGGSAASEVDDAGRGGAGGEQASSSGRGGTSGAKGECRRDADCPSDDCQTARCESGQCRLEATAEGTAVAAQVAGDCRELVCDGSGASQARPNDADAPEPSDGECQRAVCHDGELGSETLADGAACKRAAQEGTCRSGACTLQVLVNGAFEAGLDGWDASDDATLFRVGEDRDAGGRRFVATAADSDTPETLKGVLSQRFRVPADALALRFLVYGGHAHVRLRGPNGAIIEDVTGPESSALRVPVSWDLTRRRGQTLVLAIEDDFDTGSWGYVNVDGFDVIRELPENAGSIINSQFTTGLDGWDTSGDGSHFAVFDDYNYALVTGDTATSVPAYGTRRSVSTYVRDDAADKTLEAASGTLSQRITIPDDASALRFNVHGGKLARVYLSEGTTVLYSASGVEDNTRKLPVSWNLVPHRGKQLELVIEDLSTGAWGYIGVTGFDLITSYNGP